jgi:hypothetical protein
MGTHIARILVACFGTLLVVLNKPLGHMTAAWQGMLGMEATNATFNRVSYIIGGLVFVILALWAS